MQAQVLALIRQYDPKLVAAAGALVVLPLLWVLAGLLCRRRPKDAPPVWKGGLPIIGHFLKFAGNPVETMKQGYLANGPVFSMTFLGNEMTFLIGPDAQAPFYRAEDEELSQNEPYRFMTPIFGKGIVFDAPIHIKNQQLKFVAGALRPAALRTYVPQIVAEADAFLAGWGDSGEVDLMDAMARLIILTASRCLLGKEVREYLFGEVSLLLKEIDEGLNPLAIFFPYAPLPSNYRRDKARAEAQKLFSKIIADRRASGVRHDDMLQMFMEAEYKDGSKVDDYQVVGLLLAALFAGQHTSSITTTWTIMNLLHNPTEYTRAMDEVTRTFGPNPADTRAETFNFDALQSMDYLFNVVKESLRLSPPLIMLMRKAEVPLEVCGYTVPKGNLVFTSPAVSMNLPNSSPDCCFKDADKFDPDRYLPPRSEDKGRPFAFSAFGGGRHGCLGEMFGFLQVKAVASMILRQFELEPVGPKPKPNYAAMVVGPTTEHQACVVRYKRRKTPLQGPFKVGISK